MSRRGATLSQFAYGLLGLPLAMAALPVYVQIPAYYATEFGLALSGIGWILFAARFVDALQDPLIGLMIDRLSRVAPWFWMAGLLLAAAFAGLWFPPGFVDKLAWLAVMLIVAYIAHSMLNIAYLSWGARFGDGASPALLGAAAFREASGLVGVILASVVPALIFAGTNHSVGLHWYCLGFTLVLGMAIAALLYLAPSWQRSPTQHQKVSISSWKAMFRNRAFSALLAPYFLNSVSVAIPATLVLFFINDRIQTPQYAPVFLASYFIAAAAGLPFWVWLADRIGVARSWQIGMMLAILTFCGAGLLDAGQSMLFGAVCVASGLALGADLALPPVLLAQAIGADVAPAAYVGFWTLLSKAALAFSGLALPILAWLDYHPGHPAGASLSGIYAGLPCVLKCIALLLLIRITPLYKRNLT